MATSNRAIVVPLLLAFALLGGCSDGDSPPDTGAVKVTVTTEGAVPDADGYQVTLVGQPGTPVAASGEVAFDDLAPGQYSLQLAGLAANCSVAGSNPRTIDVAAGAEIVAAFAISCPAGIRILTETTGIDPDQNGFAVRIGEAVFNRVPASGSTVLTSAVVGTLRMDVNDIAENCTPDAGNPSTVSVDGPITEVTLKFSCVQATGAIQVSLTTQGWDEACTVIVVSANDQERTLRHNEITVFDDLLPGQYIVSVSGLPLGCTVAGGNAVVATVLGLQMTRVHFSVYGIF